MEKNSSNSKSDELNTSGVDLSSVIPQLEGAFAAITHAVVGVLEERLRAEIESRIQKITNEAAQTLHARIAMAMGQIQPVAIPINLLVQPATTAGALPLPSPAVVAAPETVLAPTSAAVSVGQAKEVPLGGQAPVPTAHAGHEDVLAALTPEPALEEISSPADIDDVVPTQEPDTVAPPAATRALRPHDAAPADLASQKKRIKITVVGLKPGQAHMIKNEFKLIQLSFVMANAGNSTQLTALSKSNDTVIFMTDFISHKSVDVVRSANGNFMYLSGGMTVLRDKLQEISRAHLK